LNTEITERTEDQRMKNSVRSVSSVVK
jgi:hypothetical protein